MGGWQIACCRMMHPCTSMDPLPMRAAAVKHWNASPRPRPRCSRHVVTIDGHEDVPVNDAAALQKAVAHQPVSVAICASSNLQLYGGGVFPEKSCCTELNHGVLAVGYEAEASNGAEPHWVIKNSWGEGWGEDGFFRLAKESKSPEGACGVHKAASFPLKKGSTNPEVPELCGYFGWSECPARSSCVCNFNVFDLVCLSWGCAAGAETAAAPAL